MIEKYQELVKKESENQQKLKNSIIAFLTGGLLCFSGQLFLIILKNCGFSESESISIILLILIFIASLLTCLSFFDRWVAKTKAGLIVPITGFAHSITSCILDYKKDGLIKGIGANTFKLAGSVIIYGLIVAFILAMIKAVLYVF